VLGGSATGLGVGSSSVTVSQSTPDAITSCNTFNIGAGETTTFIQPSGSSRCAQLGMGGPGAVANPWHSDGERPSHGDGVLIGPNALITVSFLATSNGTAVLPLDG
jgi:hypothetical protein